MLDRLAKLLTWLLEWATIFLMVSLTVVVLVAVFYRLADDSLSWYDEVAAIQLSWVTYYGAALAALKRSHIGLDSVLLAIPLPWRMAGVVLAEILVLGFFGLLAWTGLTVLRVLEGESLVALTWVPIQFTQSVIPVGAALFILAELLSLPGYWRQVAAGRSAGHGDLADDLADEAGA